MNRVGPADWALLLFLATLFGSNFMFIKIAVTAMPYELFVFLRLAIAAAAMVVVALVLGDRWPRGPVWWPIVGSAFFGHTLPFSLIAWGQEVVDSGISSILMAIMPLCVLGFALLLTDDEKPTPYSWAGFALALTGVIVLVGADRLSGLGQDMVRQVGVALGAVSFGINAIITKKITGLPWSTMTACLMLVGVILALPLLWFVEPAAWDLSPAIWASVFYTGVGPTALGAVLIIMIVRRQGASFLSQINFIVPVVGVFLAVTVLGESLPANAFIALAIILAGVALARRRPRRSIHTVNKGA